MPVGENTQKDEVRAIAEKDQISGLPTNRTARISALCRMATMPLILKEEAGG